MSWLIRGEWYRYNSQVTLRYAGTDDGFYDPKNFKHVKYFLASERIVMGHHEVADPEKPFRYHMSTVLKHVVRKRVHLHAGKHLIQTL